MQYPPCAASLRTAIKGVKGALWGEAVSEKEPTSRGVHRSRNPVMPARRGRTHRRRTRATGRRERKAQMPAYSIKYYRTRPRPWPRAISRGARLKPGGKCRIITLHTEWKCASVVSSKGCAFLNQFLSGFRARQRLVRLSISRTVDHSELISVIQVLLAGNVTHLTGGISPWTWKR